MASELGIDEAPAKRAGLLHDLGKAIDHEVEGPHAVIGADLARRYGERPEIVHDPASAALIHPNNVRRCVRALEMLDEGIGYADHHEGLHQRDGHYEAMSSRRFDALSKMWLR